MYRLVVLVAISAAPCIAADPPSIDKLIEQLGSKSFPERERASKALRDRGPGALPALRKALESKDEEVRKRAEVLIPPLEIQEALLPKRVTLKTDKQQIGSVLAEVTKQTGYRFTVPGTDNRALSLDFKDVPFWEALEQVGRQPRSISTYNNTEKTITLLASTGRSKFLLIHGPFRLEAKWIHEDRDVDLNGDEADKDSDRSHQLTLDVSVLAEPRITVQKIGPAKVDEAIDSEGKSLIEPPAKPKTLVIDSYVAPGRGTFRGVSLTSSDVRLRRASETAKSVKLVRGTIPVKAILIRKPVVVTSKLLDAGGTSFRAGTESMQITRVSNQGGSMQVEIIVPRENSSSREWHDRFHVEDDKGNRFQMNGRGTSSDGTTYRINMYFSPPFNKKDVGPPTKLVFEEWIVHDHEIPFEFKDLRLP